MIQFILNHTLVTLDDFRADTTLLDYLRLQKDLKGSKEGCASGDCGACTVVIASPDKAYKQLDYKTVNSCICLLGSLHGKQIITIEGLKNKAGELHPVQTSMVDFHASQCGFCTPGFVMSIFAMIKHKTKPEHHEIVKNIDGNLCRCTGYRPIIDAAKSVLNETITDHFDRQYESTLGILKSIQRAENNPFLIPETLIELTQMIEGNPDAKLVAGGTDLALDITQGLKKHERIIYLGKVDELQTINSGHDEIVIGSAASYEICASVLTNEYPELESHLNRLGSLQIRNVATIGGNIANASPIGDMPPVLLALDCRLTLQKGGKTRKVSMDDFYTGYKQTVMAQGEFIRSIHIPKKQPDHYFNVYKITKRHADDISAVCVAYSLQLSQGKISAIRIALGGMAATVIRARNGENSLLNQTLSNQTLETAKEQIKNDFKPLDDVRASRDYRIQIAQNTLQRLFIELAEVSKK